MTQCGECGREIQGRGVKCATCSIPLHKECAKKILGKFYCRKCYKQAKKTAKYELMARKDYLVRKYPKKLW